MKPLRANDAVNKALSLVGDGYIYGAKGQICSLAFREQQALQYPEQADHILGTGAKWDGKPVWDCAQLTRAAAKAAGVTLVSGATSQWTKTDWDERGEIEGLPAGETVFLYRRQAGSSTTMQHTGIALGDGTAVHARGTAYGVVRQRVQDYPWTHWARPNWPDENAQEVSNDMVDAIVVGPANETVNLRDLPSKGAAVKTRVPVGERVSAGEEKDGWRSVSHNGATGYMMAKYLQDADSAAEETETMMQISLPASAVQALKEALANL